MFKRSAISVAVSAVTILSVVLPAAAQASGKFW